MRGDHDGIGISSTVDHRINYNFSTVSETELIVTCTTNQAVSIRTTNNDVGRGVTDQRVRTIVTIQGDSTNCVRGINVFSRRTGRKTNSIGDTNFFNVHVRRQRQRLSSRRSETDHVGLGATNDGLASSVVTRSYQKHVRIRTTVHVVRTQTTYQHVSTRAAGDGIATAGTGERVAVGRANDRKTLALVRQVDGDTGLSGCGRNGRNATQFGIKRSVQVV